MAEPEYVIFKTVGEWEIVVNTRGSFKLRKPGGEPQASSFYSLSAAELEIAAIERRKQRHGDRNIPVHLLNQRTGELRPATFTRVSRKKGEAGFAFKVGNDREVHESVDVNPYKDGSYSSAYLVLAPERILVAAEVARSIQSLYAQQVSIEKQLKAARLLLRTSIEANSLTARYVPDEKDAIDAEDKLLASLAATIGATVPKP